MSYFSVRSAISDATSGGSASTQAVDHIIKAGGNEIYVEEHDLVESLLKDVDAGKVKMTSDDRDRLESAFRLRDGALVSSKGALRTFINHITAPIVIGMLGLLFSKKPSLPEKIVAFGVGGLATVALSPITLLTGSFFGAKRLFED